MVRHNYPSPQFITRAGKLTKVVLNDLRYISAAQVTLAATFVQVSLQFRPSFVVVLNFVKMLPLGSKRFRKTIGEAKRNKLR